MNDQNLNLLAATDIHLRSEEDFRIDRLGDYVKASETEYDKILILGDVIDRVPSKREDVDRELFQRFISGFEELGDQTGIDTLLVSGNHDYDLYGSNLEPYENVHDVGNSSHRSPGSTFIGYGVQNFDIGPEIRYPDLESLEDVELGRLEEELMDYTRGENTRRELANNLGVDSGEMAEFYDQVKRYEQVIGGLAEALEPSGDDIRIFLSHIAPFNTELDMKDMHGEHIEHWGSIATKNFIRGWRPDLALSGHQNYEAFDTVADSETIALGLDEASLYSIDVGEDGFSYEVLGQ